MADTTTMDAMELVRKHLEAAGEDQLREMVKLMAEGLMSAEAQAQCGAEYGMPSGFPLYAPPPPLPAPSSSLGVSHVLLAGAVERSIHRVAVGAGAGASLLEDARRAGALVCGEPRRAALQQLPARARARTACIRVCVTIIT